MASITYLTSIEFGPGSLSTLSEQLAAAGIRRPLLVSDSGLRSSGLVERVQRLCPTGTPLFVDVPANPTEHASRLALETYKAEMCDGICAVGGGSPIDLSKCVAL